MLNTKQKYKKKLDQLKWTYHAQLRFKNICSGSSALIFYVLLIWNVSKDWETGLGTISNYEAPSAGSIGK